MRRIFRYLKSSQGLALCYRPKGEGLYGYFNADFAADITGRRSIMGYIFIINGGAVT